MANQINVKNVDPEVMKRAKVMSAETGKSLSEILRTDLERLVREYEQEKKAKK